MATVNHSLKPSNNHGGVRPNSGRKAESFRRKCSELAASPKFFEFAKKVFNRDKVEPRLTKDGTIVYLEASVGDMVFLWEKLAQYGFGKPIDFDPKQLVAPLQSVINDTQTLKLLYAHNFNASRDGESHPAFVESRTPPLQTGSRPA